MSEKNTSTHISLNEVSSTSSITTNLADADLTLHFIKNYELSHKIIPEVNISSVFRKIDGKMMVLMLMTYFLQFLDKVSLNYANIMGITNDTHMHGNEFSDLATFFFVAFLCFEPIQGLFLHKFPASKVLAVNIIIWGVLCCCTASTSTFGGIMTVRVLLGCSEAAISPCLILITTTWFDSSQSALRMGFWYSGLGLGQIIGGVISYLFQLVSETAPVHGWKIMFIVIGGMNLICGVLCYFFLPNDPISCSFLNDDEKYALVMKLTESKVAGKSSKVEMYQVWESLKDITFYLFFILSATISFSSITISTFSAKNIMSFGFNSKQSALLNMPSGVVSIASTLLSTYLIMKGFPRSFAIMILCLPAVTGGALISFLPSTNQAGLLVGIYMINTIVAPLAIVYAWIGACVSGHTKKVCFNISVMFGFAVGNIVGPQSYRVADAPDFLPAKVSMLATQAVSIVFAAMILAIYYLRNKRREGIEFDEDEVEKAWSNKTDFENLSFRYVY